MGQAHLFNPLTHISLPRITRGPHGARRADPQARKKKKKDFGGVNVLFFFLFHFGVENYKGHWNHNLIKTRFWSSFGDEIHI